MLEKEVVEHIAKLARISLSEKEITKFQKELGNVLDYFQILEEIDVSGIEPMIYSVVLENVQRKDIAKKKTPHDGRHLIDMAPETKNGYLKVKSIL